ncbi:MAG: hypothetical protein PF551_02525 [Candidatus Marinimicrobia bacterium]|jgi:hypothetical protein|nr:hypothetical protein [Candidatus Neomarinimicrobiota bacterium]
MKNPIEEFLKIIDSIYGLFLDSTQGFHNNIEKLKAGQSISVRTLKISIEQQDKHAMIYGKGNPNDKDSYELHRCTQGELKNRNEKNGKNTSLIGNLCLCQIYNYWEDYFREEIALYLEIKKNELLSDIFGDLRFYRQSIIHKRGLAIKEVEKCKILNWYKHNDTIKIDEHNFEEIIYQLKIYLRGIKK